MFLDEKTLYIFNFFVFSASVLSESSHLLKHVEALSRDYFYIDFSHDSGHYKVESIVGGEHENHYLLLAFEGERFQVDISSDDKYVGYVVHNDSYTIESKVWDEQEQMTRFIVKVKYQQTWIDLSFSAHPFAEYQLEISKLTD